MTRSPHMRQRKYGSDLMTSHMLHAVIFFRQWKPDSNLKCARERHCQMQCNSPPLGRTKTCLRSMCQKDWTEYKCENCHAKEKNP